MNNKRGKLVIKELKGAKLVAWTKSALSKFKLHKGSRAGIIVDKHGVPQLFVFDTSAFLDILSTIDESFLLPTLWSEPNHWLTCPLPPIDSVSASIESPSTWKEIQYL